MFQDRLLKSFYYSFVFFTYIFLYLPIFVLIVYSFNQGGFPDVWSGFSLHWYNDLFNSVEIWRAFKHSIIIAFLSSIFSVFLGMLFVHGARAYKQNLSSIFYSNVIVSDIVLAVGLLSFFSIITVPLGMTAIIAGHTLLGMGFVIPVLKGRYDELDDSLVEASLDLGASTRYTFFKVVLPFLYPAILSSFLLAIIISFDDFLIAFFCSGASVQTLSLYIFSMIRSGISPVVNALSALLLIGSLCMVAIIGILQKNLARR